MVCVLKTEKKKFGAETVSVSNFQGISQEIVLKASFKGTEFTTPQRSRKRRKHRPENLIKFYKLCVHGHAICNVELFCSNCVEIASKKLVD